MKTEVKNVIESLKREEHKICFEFVRKQFRLFIEYKEYCEKAGYEKVTEAFSIVPINEQEFVFLNNPHIVKMLLAMKLSQPSVGEW